MSERLSQGQIDALLDMMKDNKSYEEVTAKAEDEQEDYRTYDFYSPKKFTKDKLRLLESIYDNYARIVTSQINSLFRVTSTVEVLSVEEQRYYEFCNALNDNDILSLIDVDLKEHPKRLPILLHVTTRLMLNMIDRMLGGSGYDPTIQNIDRYNYTEIELSLYKRIVQYLINPMSTAWNNYIDVNFEFERVEENSAMFHGFSVDGTVIILVLGVEMGPVKEKINICIPGDLLTELFILLEEKQYFKLDNDGERKTNKEEIMDNLRESLLDVTAQLGTVELNMDDIYNLHVGDIIELGKPKDSSVCLFIEGVPWFLGKMGSHNKNMAVMIEKRIGREETKEEIVEKMEEQMELKQEKEELRERI